MPKILFTLISFVALSALVACGGGNSNTISVPAGPSGGNAAGFSNASLNGNYVFAVNGVNSRNSFAVAGVFTADGAGNITTGVRDTVNDGGNQSLNEQINGTYSVNQDGRGQLVLNGGSGQVIYRFVLQSATSLQAPVVGKLFEDGASSNNVVIDAIGTIEAQASVPGNVLGGTATFVVRLDGEDRALLPYGAVGGLTLSAGSIPTGTIDENDFGAFNPQLAASGSYGLSANGRGTLSYVTPSSNAATLAPQGSHNFVVYYVTPNRLELVSTDTQFFLHGNAQAQSATAGTFTGDQVFGISGTDVTNPNNLVPAQETGRFTLSGTSGIVNGIADYNDAGTLFTDTAFTGTYSLTPNGRWVANLNYPASTITPASLGLVGWQVSSQQSLVLSTSSNLLETGDLRAQTLGLTTADVTGNFDEDLSGYNGTNGNFESTGNLLANGTGGLVGTTDSQSDSLGLNFDAGVSGSYFIDPTFGRGSGFIGSIPVSIYTVDANTMYLFSTDSNSLYQGTMVHQ